jgi:hypothetical protein
MEGLIKYSEEFVTPTGLKKWVGIEIPYDINSQDPSELFAQAEIKVQAFGNKQQQYTQGELPVIQVEKETAEDRRIAQFVKDIEGCMTLKTLGVYYNMREDSILIKNAYDKRSEFIRSGQIIPTTKNNKS